MHPRHSHSSSTVPGQATKSTHNTASTKVPCMAMHRHSGKQTKSGQVFCTRQHAACTCHMAMAAVAAAVMPLKPQAASRATITFKQCENDKVSLYYKVQGTAVPDSAGPCRALPSARFRRFSLTASEPYGPMPTAHSRIRPLPSLSLVATAAIAITAFVAGRWRRSRAPSAAATATTPATATVSGAATATTVPGLSTVMRGGPSASLLLLPATLCCLLLVLLLCRLFLHHRIRPRPLGLSF